MLLMPLIGPALLTAAVLLLLEKLAPRIGLVDAPRGHRTHEIATPVVGGLGMGVGFLAAWWWLPQTCLEPAACGGAMLMLWLGCYDDRFELRSRTKFILQWLIIAVAFGLSETLILTLGGFGLHGEELILPSAVAILMTWFGSVGLVNAVNMLDGLDGLAGSAVLMSVGWFTFAAWLIGDFDTAVLLLLLASLIIVFLGFNLRLPGRAHARVFMGDAGALMLGFLLAWSAVHLSQLPDGIPPVVALWICALPVIDTLTVMWKRHLRGRPKMQAGRDHLHHLLRARGLSVCQTVLVEAAFAFLCGLTGVSLWLMGASDWQMLMALLLVASVYAHLVMAGWAVVRSRAGQIAAVPAASSRESVQ